MKNMKLYDEKTIECPYHGTQTLIPNRLAKGGFLPCPRCVEASVSAHEVWKQTYAACLEGLMRGMVDMQLTVASMNTMIPSLLECAKIAAKIASAEHLGWVLASGQYLPEHLQIEGLSFSPVRGDVPA